MLVQHCPYVFNNPPAPFNPPACGMEPAVRVPRTVRPIYKSNGLAARLGAAAIP
jgi:hypothetical protein